MKLKMGSILLLMSLSAEARVPESRLIQESNYELSAQPLTTDSLGKIDPGQVNPHLQKWAISRQVELKGLTAIKDQDRFSVTAEGITAPVQGFVRAAGPWYRPWTEFSCSVNPDLWFATEEGTKGAAQQAGRHWMRLLKQELPRLTVFLRQTSGSTETAALASANQVFKTWVSSVETHWRQQIPKKIRAEEWTAYLEEALDQGTCGNSGKSNSKRQSVEGTQTSQASRPSWRSMMEPPVGNPTDISQLLARAPARLWNGLFTIRASIKVGDKILNGRFLIDSGAKTSVLSPSWLGAQGIYQAYIETPHATPRRATWSQQWQNAGKLARPAQVDGLDIAGLTVPLREFLIADTDFFSPPESTGFCCDGVLGLDFLRLYPMEFQTSTPTEVRVWPRENFHWASDVPWIEVSETWDQSLVSGCSLYREAGKSRKPNIHLPGVKWLTGSEKPIEIHSPWMAQTSNQIEAQSSQLWRIDCEGIEFARNVQVQPASVSAANASEKIPAFNLGMPLLLRGNFTLDLSHGRIWFAQQSFDPAKPRKNGTGLSMVYKTIQGERVLVVKSIRSNSEASDLEKVGLKKGVVITLIDRKEPSEIDLWEVERRLAGDYAENVELQWKTTKGLTSATLQVRDTEKD